MLDTVLQIGRTFRTANTIKQHRYIASPYNPKSKQEITYVSIPVSSTFKFSRPKVGGIDETTIHKKLFFLRYQTSDNDSATKTLFGDIYRFLKKGGKEGGNYRSKRRSGFSSFERAEEDAGEINDATITAFREAFLENTDMVEKALDSAETVYLHFDFSGKHWYELPGVLDAINKQMARKFASVHGDTGLYTFDKTLYRSICSGDEKNDVQFPDFLSAGKHRSASFTEEQMKDLFFGINYSETPLVSDYETKSSIKIVVLPKGEQLTADDLERFSQRDLTEKNLIQQHVEFDIDRLFSPFLWEVPENIVSFDVLFCKTGANVDSDVLDIPSVQRSHLEQIHETIRKARLSVEEQQKMELGVEPQRRNLIWTFYSIFGDNSQKYQRHLFKVLPQIYRGIYKRDEVLLSAFIEKIEFNTRSETRNFNFLKYDYYFLINIQSSNGGSTMDDLHNSKSYKAGLLLGKLAQPVSWEIKSFEKNYVGLLSRRIADTNGLIKLANFVNERLAIHDVAYPNLKADSVELAKIVSDIPESEYNKNYCAFGFFESYFAYTTQIRS